MDHENENHMMVDPYEVLGGDESPTTFELVQMVAGLRRELAASKAANGVKEGNSETTSPRGSMLNICLTTPPSSKHKHRGDTSPRTNVIDVDGSPHATPYIPYISPLTPADSPPSSGGAKGGGGGKATGGKGGSDRVAPYEVADDRQAAETASFGQGADGQDQPR